MARPTKIDDLGSVVDFPRFGVNGVGQRCAQRPKRPQIRETEWTRQLMGAFGSWRDLVGVDDGEITLEAPLAPREILNRAAQRSLGICRADAIIWHNPDHLTIIEAKVVPSPGDICAGIGQLIFYKTLAEAYWGVVVDALVLASPYLPPFILDSIANVQAPIRFLKAEDVGFSGLIPQYSLLAGEEQCPS